VPAGLRGAASGMRATFQNAGQVLSIGIFFSLMVAGLAGSLPSTLSAGLTGQGVPAATAGQVAQLPPVGTLFAAFLGYNPIAELLGPQVLGALPAANAARLTGLEFFPRLISGPFHDGLVIVFWLAIAMTVAGALVSLLRARPAPTGTGTGDADGITHEAELASELVEAAPFNPGARIAEPLSRQRDVPA
jgi:hypothetical protein